MKLFEKLPKLLTSVTLFSYSTHDLSLPHSSSFVVGGADDFSQWQWQDRVARPGMDQPVIAGLDLVSVGTLLREVMSRQPFHRPVTEPAVLEITIGPHQATDPSTGAQQMDSHC